MTDTKVYLDKNFPGWKSNPKAYLDANFRYWRYMERDETQPLEEFAVQVTESKLAASAPNDAPFAMVVLDNPKVTVAQHKEDVGVKIGQSAMVAAGAQSEFVAANILQAQALKSSIILRAGEPAQYNKERSPKSGLNLSKTSKQGFFKGALVQEERFARVGEDGVPLPHHYKDRDHLKLKPTDPDYQHTMQLDLNMRDILREVGPDGDLRVLGYDSETGFLRFEYKEGRGPSSGFNGQFVVNILTGTDKPIFYSREWDSGENDPNWDASQGIIKKPPELASIPDDLYKKIFNHTFKLQYTESKNSRPDSSELKNANVFANRARDANEFKQTMGKEHPHFHLIAQCNTLNDILSQLKDNLSEEEANNLILEVYDKGGTIVAGDWDGMALGHPPDLNPEYAEVIDLFAPGEQGNTNKETLLERADAYLDDIKNKALEKKIRGETVSSFEEKALSLPNRFTKIASEFAIARAGCITVHEFVYQQVLNHAYRDKLNAHYGEKYDTKALQTALDKLLVIKDNINSENIKSVAQSFATAELMMANSKVSPAMLDKLANHLATHFNLASKNPDKPYILPHLQHDANVHDLFQHGFDMRNPYGSNLEGAWFLITSDGTPMYGKTQEELIEVMLTGDFLAKNHIDVSHGANMGAGWGKVIERQMQLNQLIPTETLTAFMVHGDYLEKHIIEVSPDADMKKGWGKVINRQIELGQPIPPQTKERYEQFLQEQEKERIDAMKVQAKEGPTSNAPKEPIKESPPQATPPEALTKEAVVDSQAQNIAKCLSAKEHLAAMKAAKRQESTLKEEVTLNDTSTHTLGV